MRKDQGIEILMKEGGLKKRKRYRYASLKRAMMKAYGIKYATDVQISSMLRDHKFESKRITIEKGVKAVRWFYEEG